MCLFHIRKRSEKESLSLLGCGVSFHTQVWSLFPYPGVESLSIPRCGVSFLTTVWSLFPYQGGQSLCIIASCGIMVNVLNYDIVISKFELSSSKYVPSWINTLGKGINSFISPAMDWIVWLLFLYKDAFGI